MEHNVHATFTPRANADIFDMNASGANQFGKFSITGTATRDPSQPDNFVVAFFRDYIVGPPRPQQLQVSRQAAEKEPRTHGVNGAAGGEGRERKVPRKYAHDMNRSMSKRGDVMPKLVDILKHLQGKPEAFYFNQPVDPVALQIPHYVNIIKHPMDFSTIADKLSSERYNSQDDFGADVRLVFDNAVTFNVMTNDPVRGAFPQPWSDSPFHR